MSIRSSSVLSDTLRPITAPIAWSTYVAIPAAGWGWLDGVPLGPIEAAALTLVWWTWAAGRHVPGAGILAILVVAKVALAGVFVDRSIAARYYANDTWAPPIERSVEFRRQAFTRRDDRLAFGTDGARDLPLYFFNDIRFNFYRPTDPRRDQLAYSAEWIGYLRTDDASSDATFYVDTGPGISSELSVDGRQVIGLDSASPRSSPITLENGWHALTVRVKAPYGASRRIEAGQIIDGTARPFDGDSVLLRPAGSIRLVADTALRWAARVVDGVMLSWLALLVMVRARGAWRDARVVPLLWLGAIFEALLFARAYADRMVVLSGGDDWLTYESFARAIALSDWVGGGQGGPFYYQPLYPYFVALTHLGFGDSLFGAVLIQRLLLAATIGWVAVMTRRLFGARAGWVALIGGGVFLYAKGGRWTNVLLAEPLFMPLLVAWTGMLVKIATEQPSWPRVAAAGVVGGIATLTRSTLLMGWPPILLVWWASLRSRRGRSLAALLLAMLAIVGLATLRNWIVANRFVPVTTSFGINLSLGNEPTRPPAPAPAERILVYDRLGLEPYVRNVVEFAIQAPGDFARGLGNKALYSLGFFGWSALPGGIGTSWLYVGIWLLALVGVVRILRGSLTGWTSAVWLPAAGALSHFAAVVLVFPHGYTDRLILPLYPLLIPYAAFAIEPLVRRAHAQAFVNVLIATGMLTGRLIARLQSVLQLSGRWVLCNPRRWLYLGYSAAVIQQWFVWPPDGSESTRLLTGLLLPVTALTVARLTRQDLVHRFMGGALFAAAFLRVGTAGSLSAAALHDPLFWGLLAAVALGASAVTGRWPVAALAAAALAGGCTMVATLLPVFPGFESNFPDLDLSVAHQSIGALVDQLGLVGALCLLGLWIQAIVVSGPRKAATTRIAAAVRGALLAALVLSFAGALPSAGIEALQWVVALAILLGLAEAKAR